MNLFDLNNHVSGGCCIRWKSVSYWPRVKLWKGTPTTKVANMHKKHTTTSTIKHIRKEAIAWSKLLLGHLTKSGKGLFAGLVDSGFMHCSIFVARNIQIGIPAIAMKTSVLSTRLWPFLEKGAFSCQFRAFLALNGLKQACIWGWNFECPHMWKMAKVQL